jgi:hypothetical protein
MDQGAKVYITTRTPFKLSGAAGVIDDIDVQDDNCGEKFVKGMKGVKIDILINNAGYFYEPVEKIDSLNFKEELKMIDICAIGVLRITAAAVNAGLLSSGSKVGRLQFLFLSAISYHTCHGIALGRYYLISGRKHCLAVHAEPHRPRLRPPHVQGRREHGRRAPRPGAAREGHLRVPAAPGLQQDRNDQEVRAHLGGGGSRRCERGSEACGARDRPHESREHGVVRQLRRRSAHPVVNIAATRYNGRYNNNLLNVAESSVDNYIYAYKEVRFPAFINYFHP